MTPQFQQHHFGIGVTVQAVGTVKTPGFKTKNIPKLPASSRAQHHGFFLIKVPEQIKS